MAGGGVLVEGDVARDSYPGRSRRVGISKGRLHGRVWRYLQPHIGMDRQLTRQRPSPIVAAFTELILVSWEMQIVRDA
jgi:hypothetical protein